MKKIKYEFNNIKLRLSPDIFKFSGESFLYINVEKLADYNLMKYNLI